MGHISPQPPSDTRPRATARMHAPGHSMLERVQRHPVSFAATMIVAGAVSCFGVVRLFLIEPERDRLSQLASSLKEYETTRERLHVTQAELTTSKSQLQTVQDRNEQLQVDLQASHQAHVAAIEELASCRTNRRKEEIILHLIEQREELVENIRDQERDAQYLEGDAAQEESYATQVQKRGKQRRYFEITVDMIEQVAHYEQHPDLIANRNDELYKALAAGKLKAGDRVELPPFDPEEALAAAAGMKAEATLMKASLAGKYAELARLDEQILSATEMVDK